MLGGIGGGGGGGRQVVIPVNGGGSDLLPGLVPKLTCDLLDIKVVLQKCGIVGNLLLGLGLGGGGGGGSCASADPNLLRYTSNWQDFCYYRRNVANSASQQCMGNSLIGDLGLEINKCCNQIATLGMYRIDQFSMKSHSMNLFYLRYKNSNSAI